MPGNKVIENYEPSDEGRGVVIGPLVRPTPKKADVEQDAEASADEDAE